jgi:hypothetical protein
MRYFERIAPLLALFLALPGVAGAQGWTTRRPMPTPRYGVAGAVLDGRIYVIGGSQTPSESRGMAVVEVYDPDTDTWDTSIPPLAEPRLNAAAVAFDGKIYVLGGRDGSELLESVEVYDPAQGRWEPAHDLREEKEGFAAVIHAGTIFLLGGFGEEGQFLDEVEALDVGSGEWEEQSWALSLPRASLSAVSLADSIFALGGLYYGPLDLVERYHETEGFEVRRPLLEPRASAGSAVSGKSIYIAGGMSAEGIVATLEVYSTDGQDPTWVELEPMSKARSALTLEAWDGRLYAIGGRGDGDTPLDLCEEFRIPTGIEENDPPSIPRAILLGQNRPNPFNGGTDITFEVPAGGERITVAIYDVRGRLVRTLEDRTLPAGRYVVHWDGLDRLGRDAPTSHYFCRMTRGRTVLTRKLLLAR